MILYGGRIELEGALRDLLEKKDVFQLSARNVSEALQAKLSEVAAEGGATEVQTGRARVRLEDLFKELVARKRSGESR